MNKIKLGCALLLVASLAQAEDSNKWYAGVSAGQAKSSGWQLTSTQSIVDDKDTAYKVYGGYEFNKYISAELYYTDLGTHKGREDTTIADIDSKSYGMTAIVSYPVHKHIEPFVKAGLQHWKGKASVEGTTFLTDSGNDPIYGVGVNFPITESLAIRTEYEVIEFDKVDYNFLSAGLIYKF